MVGKYSVGDDCRAGTIKISQLEKTNASLQKINLKLQTKSILFL